MKALRILRNYYFYCGIEKEEYDAIKKDVYASNFFIWRILHFFMASVFLALYISSLMNRLLKVNSIFYLMAFLYAAAGIAVFCFIFYSLVEYGNVIDAGTNATEDAIDQGKKAKR